MAVERRPVLLLQFAREPVPGQVKTRMIPQLTPIQACDLHRELVVWTCDQLLEAQLGDVEIAVAGEPFDPLFSRCLTSGVARLSRQRGQDLGQRMHNALRKGLADYANVVLVGSDCPGINADYLRLALQGLREVDVVLGPALDGGYVLIAVKRLDARVFEGIPWGTGEVLRRTENALELTGLSWRTLPPLADVDVPGDLPVWEKFNKAAH